MEVGGRMVVGLCWNTATRLSQESGDRVVEGLAHAERPGVVACKEQAGAVAWPPIQAKTDLWKGSG